MKGSNTKANRFVETPKSEKRMEASGAAGNLGEKTAVFFISPFSDVKEEVLNYYEIKKRQ